MTWTQRTKTAMQKPRKATWAAVALGVISILTQLLNFVRVDLQPLIIKLDQIDAKTTRIEQRLEDHERRLQNLEYLHTQSLIEKVKLPNKAIKN